MTNQENKNQNANQTAQDQITTANGKKYITLCYELSNGKNYGELLVSYGGHSCTIQARANGDYKLPVERLAIPFRKADIDITEQAQITIESQTAQTFTHKGEYYGERVYNEKGYQTITDSADIIANLAYIKQTVNRIDEGKATKQDCDTIIGLLANARAQLEKQDAYNLDKLVDNQITAQKWHGVAIEKADTEKAEHYAAEVENLENQIAQVNALFAAMGKYAVKAQNWKTKLANRESQTASKAFDGLLAIFNIE